VAPQRISAGAGSTGAFNKDKQSLEQAGAYRTLVSVGLRFDDTPRYRLVSSRRHGVGMRRRFRRRGSRLALRRLARAELRSGHGEYPSARLIDRIRRGRDLPRQKRAARRCVSLDLKQHRIDYSGCGEPKLRSVRCWTFFCRSKEAAPLAQTGPDRIRNTRKCRITV